MSSLYFCYQAILEPLTQTQVIPYLEGLAQGGYSIALLTFESRQLTQTEIIYWQTYLQGIGITWYWARYHKRPTVPATSFDILVGIIRGLWLVKRHRVRLLHARSHVPGLMALVLKWLTGARFLFDIRGFMAEEYVDAGVWPAHGLLFRLTKRIERSLVKSADGIVLLTHRGASQLREWYPIETREKPVEIIPCCVDRRQNNIPDPSFLVKDVAEQQWVFAYVGKLGGWYLTAEMIGFMATALEMLPNCSFRVWTQSDAAPLRTAICGTSLEGRVEIGQLPAHEVASALRNVHAGLAFIKPCPSKIASSATKIGDYLEAGLPVIATAGIGDTDAILLEPRPGSQPIGVLLSEFSHGAFQIAIRELLTLLKDPQTSVRCREAARDHFDLQQVGWTRYRKLYAQLLEANSCLPFRKPLSSVGSTGHPFPSDSS